MQQINKIEDYDKKMIRGEMLPTYKFGEGVIEGEELGISEKFISMPGNKTGVSLKVENPFPDMTDGTD